MVGKVRMEGWRRLLELETVLWGNEVRQKGSVSVGE